MNDKIRTSEETITIEFPRYVVCEGTIRCNDKVKDYDTIRTVIDCTNIKLESDILPRFCDRVKVDDRSMNFTDREEILVNGESTKPKKFREVRTHAQADIWNECIKHEEYGLALVRPIEDLRPREKGPSKKREPTESDIERKFREDPAFAARILEKYGKRGG